jgi:uncharacterized BrkB/YihY/UPF0761 family membrane protein
MDGSTERDDPSRARGAALRARAAAVRARGDEVRARLEQRYGETTPFGVVRDVVSLDRAVAGGELAGALAYRLFLWFLPFVLLLVAGLGVYSDTVDESPEQVAGRLGLAGLVADSVARAARSDARWYALAVGVPVLLYVTRTLLRTVVAVHRLAWGLEPRRGLLTAANVLLFLAALLAFVFTGAAVSAATSWTPWSWLVAVPAAVLARGALWLGVSTRLPRPACPWTALLPGAAVVGVGFLLANAFSALVIGRIAAAREDTYGALGVAAAVLFSLWLTSRVVVVAAVANAALWARRGQRAYGDEGSSEGSSPGAGSASVSRTSAS